MRTSPRPALPCHAAVPRLPAPCRLHQHPGGKAAWRRKARAGAAAWLETGSPPSMLGVRGHCLDKLQRRSCGLHRLGRAMRMHTCTSKPRPSLEGSFRCWPAEPTWRARWCRIYRRGGTAACCGTRCGRPSRRTRTRRTLRRSRSRRRREWRRALRLPVAAVWGAEARTSVSMNRLAIWGACAGYPAGCSASRAVTGAQPRAPAWLLPLAAILARPLPDRLSMGCRLLPCIL